MEARDRDGKRAPRPGDSTLQEAHPNAISVASECKEASVAIWLKRGRNAETTAADDRQVRDTVEVILADVSTRGDAAVRELSIRFDAWDRETYRLDDREIQDCLDQMSAQDLKDI